MSMEVIFLLLGIFLYFIKKTIYSFLFFSGYVSTASTAAVITNSIYSLDPIGFHWKRQTSSSSYRYLHSAVASSGIFFKNYYFYGVLNLTKGKLISTSLFGAFKNTKKN